MACASTVLVIGGVIFVALAHFLFLFRRTPSTKGRKARSVRPPIETVLANKKHAPYEVKDLHGPLLMGRVLAVLIRRAFTPFGKWLIVDRSMKKSNTKLMGGEYIPETPWFMGVPPPSETTPSDDENKQAIKELDSPPSTTGTFRYNTILDFYHAYKSKRSTPVGVAKRALKAMTEGNQAIPPLLAIIEWDESVVMAMAEASTDRWERGEPLSYLDGVPVAVKGETLVEPYPLMGGAKFKAALCENVIEGDLIKRLREAGAVLIGVANMQEFGTGTLGSNPNIGTARNPYNTDHYCGGSSSGSGSSVAAGLCPLAIGADGGGSVRIPSSLCGITGLKPTSQLLTMKGCTPLAYAVSVAGPMASSALDVAIAMDVFLHGSGKPFSLKELGTVQFLSGLRVGMYTQFFKHADKEVVASCEKSLEVLKGLGAVVKEIVIPELEELRIAHLCLITSEMHNNLAVDVDKHFDEFNPETLMLLCVGRDFSSHEYINSLKQRTRGIKIMEDVFEEVDVIITPSSAIPSPRIYPGAVSHGVLDITTSGQLMRFMFLANITGIPGISLPVGTSNDGGLPLGLQLMAPWHKDGLLVAIGHALQKETGHLLKKPKIYYDLLDEN